jgi:hypothetical protein
VCRAVRGRNGPFEEDADERDEVESSDRRDAFLDSRSIICLLAAHLSSLIAFVSCYYHFRSFPSPSLSSLNPYSNDVFSFSFTSPHLSY